MEDGGGRGRSGGALLMAPNRLLVFAEARLGR